MYLIFSCSLRANSCSFLLAQEAFKEIQSRGDEVELIDLRNWNLPYCDGQTTAGHPEVLILGEKVKAAKGILLAAPIYNYAMSSLSRGLVELTSGNWEGKVVGLLYTAGGKRAYMAPMGLANSLLLHYHCIILPRFVCGSEAQFENAKIVDVELNKRIVKQVDMLLQLSSALIQEL